MPLETLLLGVQAHGGGPAYLVGGERVAGVRSLTEAANTTPSTSPRGRDDRTAGVARSDQPAQREHMAGDGPVAVDVG